MPMHGKIFKLFISQFTLAILLQVVQWAAFCCWMKVVENE